MTHRRQRRDQLALVLASDQADGQRALARQLSGAFGELVGDVFQLFGIGVVVEHGVFEQVALERIERKRFLVVAQLRGLAEHHGQPLAEEVAHRLTQKAGQRAELEAVLVVQRERRQHVCRRRIFGAIDTSASVGTVVRCAPLARIGQQAIVLEIAAAERLQRMLGSAFL